MRTVLERPYHLSYPFVFRDDGVFILYLNLQATVRLNSIARRFPFRGSYKGAIPRKGSRYHSIHRQNVFWFFTTLKAPAGDGMCLCLFYSDRIDGEWHWHPANPISMDVGTHDAGVVFSTKWKANRTSQDCLGRYGSSFSFREIVTLTKTEYKEKHLRTIMPWSNHSGVHIPTTIALAWRLSIVWLTRRNLPRVCPLNCEERAPYRVSED